MSREKKFWQFSTAVLMGLSLSLAIAPAAISQPDVPRDVKFLIGKWKGVSTHHFPRRDRDPISEDVAFDCISVLKGAYVKCDTAWTRRDKSTTRTFYIFINHHESEGALQTLYIYDNWPDHGSHFMRPVSGHASDTDVSTYLSEHAITDEEGRPIEEKTWWEIDVEKGQLTGFEHSHYENEPEGEYKLTFSFVLEKVGS